MTEILWMLVFAATAVTITATIVVVTAVHTDRKLDKSMAHLTPNPAWKPETPIARTVTELTAHGERSTKNREAYRTALHHCANTLTGYGFTVTEEPFTHTGVHFGDVHPLWKFRLFPWRKGKLNGVNLVAVKPAVNQTLPPLILVAHLDTVTGSPGADDNTSGVATILRVAEHLENTTPHRTVYCVLLDHEEVGLVGAKRFTRRHRELVSAADIIVLESVGYYDNTPNSQQFPWNVRISLPHATRERLHATHNTADFLAVGYRTHTKQLAEAVETHLESFNVPTIPFWDPRSHTKPALSALYSLWPPLGKFGRSDHKPMWDIGANAIVLNDTVRWRGSPYHRKQDLPEFLDYTKLENTALALTRLALPPKP